MPPPRWNVRWRRAASCLSTVYDAIAHRAFVYAGQPRPHLVGPGGARLIGLQGVLSGTGPTIRSTLRGAVPGHRRPRAVADDLAFTGVLAGAGLGLYDVRHVIGQSDRQLGGGGSRD